jgi:hypothetical protein
VADSATPSLTAVLDDLRPLIVAARDRGERPRYVVLPPEPYALVAACKFADRDKGMPMLVLGLEVVPTDEPPRSPRVF